MHPFRQAHKPGATDARRSPRITSTLPVGKAP